MAQTPWTDDWLDGFEQRTLVAPQAADGPVELVLVRRRVASGGRRAVLYVHGFCDYFFQVHLADFFNREGLHFYAIDLRRHGRSLRPHQVPNDTRDLDEYLQDIDLAIEVLRRDEGVQGLLLNGHSTGGLVAALHAQRGVERGALHALLLNSPFFDWYLPRWKKLGLLPWVAAIGRCWPALEIPSPPSVYGRSLHADHFGRWRYDLRYKPLDGFAVHAGWVRAIRRAQQEVAHGLAIACPVLVLHARQSLQLDHWDPRALQADIVLDVADIARVAPRLGPQVDVQAIDGAVHDVFLSSDAPRQAAFDAVHRWLQRIGV